MTPEHTACDSEHTGFLCFPHLLLLHTDVVQSHICIAIHSSLKLAQNVQGLG